MIKRRKLRTSSPTLLPARILARGGINANEVNITSFLGSARMSVTPVGNMLRLQLDNTTDQHSLDGHLPWIQGVPRSPGQLTPQGTTYQRFIWYVEIK